MNYKKGDRVCTVMEHTETGEEKERWGTVDSDQIHGWDYVDVVFDDFKMVTPVVSWYLFREKDRIKEGS